MGLVIYPISPKLSGPTQRIAAMPNISTLLKSEITRLARREIKKELASVKTAYGAYRRYMAALKRQVAALERKSAQLAKRSQSTSSMAPVGMPERQVRFVAKGFAALRKRLGLSAAQLGALIGASEQSVYNWETKKAVPRKEHSQQLSNFAVLANARLTKD